MLLPLARSYKRLGKFHLGGLKVDGYDEIFHGHVCPKARLIDVSQFIIL